MSERRSSRSHGSVKYSGFDDGDESDDDFAVSSHTAKKQKSSKTDEAAKKSNKSVKDKSLTLDRDVKKHVITSQNSVKTRRAPLSEKVYERELQEALELSLVETGTSQDVESYDLDKNKPQVSETPISAADDDISNSRQPVSSSGNTRTEPQSEKASVNTTIIDCSTRFAHGTVVVDDSIELIESEIADGSITQQRPTRKTHDRQASKKPRLIDMNDESSDESDFNPDDDSNEDENISNTENDDEETESNTDRKSKKLKTPNPKRKTKSSALASKASKSIQIASLKGARKTIVKSQPPVPASTISLCPNNPPINVSKPSTVSSKSTPAPKVSSQRIPASLVSPWKPPSQGSSAQASATTHRSPSSGLRLGLSRNQRVKPLHPSV